MKVLISNFISFFKVCNWCDEKEENESFIDSVVIDPGWEVSPGADNWMSDWLIIQPRCEEILKSQVINNLPPNYLPRCSLIAKLWICLTFKDFNQSTKARVNSEKKVVRQCWEEIWSISNDQHGQFSCSSLKEALLKKLFYNQKIILKSAGKPFF